MLFAGVVGAAATMATTARRERSWVLKLTIVTVESCFVLKVLDVEVVIRYSSADDEQKIQDRGSL